MSVYTYKCKKCNEEFDVVQRMIADRFKTHDEAQESSECDGEVVRLLSAPAVHFKGSGFYETDYKRATTGKKGGKTKNENKPKQTTDGDGLKVEGNTITQKLN